MVLPLEASTSATTNEMRDTSFSSLLGLARDGQDYIYPTTSGLDALFNIA